MIYKKLKAIIAIFIGAFLYGLIAVVSYTVGFIIQPGGSRTCSEVLWDYDWLFAILVFLYTFVFTVLYIYGTKTEKRSIIKPLAIAVPILFVAYTKTMSIFTEKHTLPVWIAYCILWAGIMLFRSFRFTKCKVFWKTAVKRVQLPPPQNDEVSNSTIRNCYDNPWSRVRYALVFPALCTVAVNMFFGSTYKIFSNDYHYMPIVCLILFVAYFFLLEKHCDPFSIYIRKTRNGNTLFTPRDAYLCSTQRYALLNSALLVILCIVSLLMLFVYSQISLGNISASPALLNCIFVAYAFINAIVVAAGLSIFESWGIFAEGSERNNSVQMTNVMPNNNQAQTRCALPEDTLADNRVLVETEDKERDRKNENIYYRNYISILLILCPAAVISIWPFSPYNRSFLVFFLTLSVISEWFWLSQIIDKTDEKIPDKKKLALKVLRVVFSLFLLATIAHDWVCPDIRIIREPDPSKSEATWLAAITAAVAFLGWLGVGVSRARTAYRKGDESKEGDESREEESELVPIPNISKINTIETYLLCQLFWMLVVFTTLILLINITTINWDMLRAHLYNRMRVSLEFCSIIIWITMLYLVFYRFRRGAGFKKNK